MIIKTFSGTLEPARSCREDVLLSLEITGQKNSLWFSLVNKYCSSMDGAYKNSLHFHYLIFCCKLSLFTQ